LLRKPHNLLRRFVIVQNAEVSLIQVTYELAMLIHGDEQHVHFVDSRFYSDDGIRFSGCDGWRSGREVNAGGGERILPVQWQGSHEDHRETRSPMCVLHSQSA